MRLTNNFKLQEFGCRDGSLPEGELLENCRELAENLQVLRDHIKKPINIISGYRPPAYNTKIGGAKKSQHLLARAADIKVSGMAPVEVHATVLQLIKAGKMKQGGVGKYSTFVHYDTRGTAARWSGGK
jgi:uncharacterized protein YcbK (DUF882 family)